MDKKQIEDLLKSVKSSENSRNTHKPYSETSGRLPDFEVEYRLAIDESLNSITLTQGMRCDFKYADDVNASGAIYKIWPEILDAEGNVVLDKSKTIPDEGRATMWIGDPQMREDVHRKRIQVGTTGHWVIGSKKIADVTVTNLIGLTSF